MKNDSKNMPGLLRWFVDLMLSGSSLSSVPGDFEEEYNERLRNSGALKAWLWILRQTIKALPSLIAISFYGSIAMFKNYLKIMFRNLVKQKLYSFINISGLALGMTCSILIFLFIRYELSYDSFHEDAGDIYRIVLEQKQTDNNGWWYGTPPVLAPTLVQDFPDINHAVRFSRGSQHIRCNNEKFTEYGFYFADPEFLELFAFPLVSGNPENALNEPFSVLISEEMRDKYFNGTDPIGKTIDQFYNEKYHSFRITGVLKNLPENTHVDFKFLASFESLRTMVVDPAGWFTKWGNNRLETYVKIKKNVDPVYLEQKLSDYAYQIQTMNVSYHIQPIINIHLQGSTFGGVEANRDLSNIFIFSAVAVFIIIIACFNYINLTTAMFKKRAKEVGMRKVIGAGRKQIILQFLGESLVMSFTALCISLILLGILVRHFGQIIGKDISFSLLTDPGVLITVISAALITAVISGSYPAIFLSSFEPVKIIKGNFSVSPGGSAPFRNSLVTIQFVISTVLIICILVTSGQLDYLRNKKLGYEKEHIIIVNLAGNIKKNYEAIKDELLKNPGILKVSASAGSPMSLGWYSRPVWRGYDPSRNIFVPRLIGDTDIVDVYGLEIMKGRNFTAEDKASPEIEYILNETAVSMAGWDDPIGKEFGFDGEINGKVIGIVKDFHTLSLHHKIGPVAVEMSDPYYYFDLSIKTNGKNISETLDYIRNIYEGFSPQFAFDYEFFDETFDVYYKTEERLGSTFRYFTLLAIFITCLGLFGLASFTTENRRKEIGIKKVLGSAVIRIVGLFLKEFVFLLIIANLIAWPVAYFAMNKWLQNFAYRIEPGIMIFVAASIMSLVITVGSIGFQVVKASLANPVESLRYE
ncbi:ABC transporter permease [candidate division KSB1 bacterium]